MNDLCIPPNHRRFMLDWKDEICFLVDAYKELDCAEVKFRQIFKRLDELNWIQQEDARCVARCGWLDAEYDDNNKDWKQWLTVVVSSSARRIEYWGLFRSEKAEAWRVWKGSK